MKIAVIGYGSLIWDLDDLASNVSGDWHEGRGPAMPVEFSRVSPKRKLALVLVIDPSVGTPSSTSFITSSRNRLDDAMSDLARRERTSRDHIGAATRDGVVSDYSGVAGPAVTNWLNTTTIDAAVWTDLDGNFDDATATPFSHAAGLDYLKQLQGAALVEAWRYITYAPKETDTPFRRYLNCNAWWQQLDFDNVIS